MTSPYIKPALKLNSLNSRRGSIDSHNISLTTPRRGSLSLAKHVDLSSVNSQPSRQRSSSFGFALPVTKLKAKSLREQVLKRSKEDMSVTSSAESLPCSGDSSPEILPHHLEPQHSSQNCQKCKRHMMRQTSLRESINNDDDQLVFDYTNGVIRHKQRPKTAFGSTFYRQKSVSTSPTTPRRSVKQQVSNTEESNQTENEEPLSADDFINLCIIDSQTPRLKPAQKPNTSDTFSKLLEEFLPSKDQSDEIPEIKVVPRRARSNSLPVISWKPDENNATLN